MVRCVNKPINCSFIDSHLSRVHFEEFPTAHCGFCITDLYSLSSLALWPHVLNNSYIHWFICIFIVFVTRLILMQRRFFTDIFCLCLISNGLGEESGYTLEYLQFFCLTWTSQGIFELAFFILQFIIMLSCIFAILFLPLFFSTLYSPRHLLSSLLSPLVSLFSSVRLHSHYMRREKTRRSVCQSRGNFNTSII